MEILGCLLPEDRLYDLEHDVWWQPEGAEARIGILATLAAFAGPFVSFAYRPVRGSIEGGRSVATIESVRFTGAVRLPVAAVVVDRNPELAARPRLLNDAPYDAGWVARVRPERPEEVPGRLEPAAHVASRLEERIRTLRIRCWPATPDVELHEIGVECSAVLTMLTEEVARRPTGTHLLLVTDDPTSPIEMVRWSDRTGYPVLAHRVEGTLQQFLVHKVAAPEPRKRRGGVVG